MTAEELKKAISDAIGMSVDVSERRDTFEVSIESYGFDLTFANLMTVAEILGTTEFSIDEEIIQGTVYSEVTRDPDTVVKRIVVSKEKMGNGVPWKRESRRRR